MHNPTIARTSMQVKPAVRITRPTMPLAQEPPKGHRDVADEWGMYADSYENLSRDYNQF